MAETGLIGGATWTSTLDYGSIGAVVYAGVTAASSSGGGGGPGPDGVLYRTFPKAGDKRAFPTMSGRAFPHE